MDLTEGRVLLLGPGPGMRTTWDPAIGERYAIWFEAERQASLAAQAIAYDTQTGRRWTLGDIGSVYSYPAISGDLAVWCSALQLGTPGIHGVRIGSGDRLEVAALYGAPVVSGSLVVWAESWTGPFTAKEIASGTSWPLAAGLTDDKLTGLALAGRTLVWGQSSQARAPEWWPPSTSTAAGRRHSRPGSPAWPDLPTTARPSSGARAPRTAPA